MNVSQSIRRVRAPWIDVAIAALFVGLTIVEAQAGTWDAAGWRVGAMALLAWRRTFPTLVATAVVAVALLSDVNGQTAATLAMALACFTVGSELPPRRSSVALGGLLAAAAVAGLIGGAVAVPSDVAAFFIFIAGPALIGMSQHQRMLAEAAATARAVRAEEVAAMEAERGAMRERARIARELHDIVSHSLTVITINAQAVRRALTPTQEREVEALGSIEDTARDASAEMRRLLGVLRRDSPQAPREPQPGLGQLPTLVERCAEAGLDVTVEAHGTVGLPAGLDVAAFRIIQEALTNVLRHADASAAVVGVGRREGALRVTVEDNGHGGSPNGLGHGLAGIRERASVYGGDAQFDSSESGFRVDVTLPLREPS